MQAFSVYLPSSPTFLCTKTANTILFPTTTKHQLIIIIKKSRISVKAASVSDSDSAASEFDYSSLASSVFPAEACETVGGDACDVEMFPETKLITTPTPPPPNSNTNVVPAASQTETDDREYLDYNTPKTVFIEEACDDLGGEFCDPASASASA